MTEFFPLNNVKQSHDTPLSLEEGPKKVSPHWPRALVQAVNGPANKHNLSAGGVAPEIKPTQ